MPTIEVPTTIYQQLQNLLNVTLEPAPDEWHFLYDLDFLIPIGEHTIGLQIALVSCHAVESYKFSDVQGEAHHQFQDQHGAVFTIVSVVQEGRKVIVNPEVITNIEREIVRLRTIEAKT